MFQISRIAGSASFGSILLSATLSPPHQDLAGQHPMFAAFPISRVAAEHSRPYLNPEDHYSRRPLPYLRASVLHQKPETFTLVCAIRAQCRIIGKNGSTPNHGHPAYLSCSFRVKVAFPFIAHSSRMWDQLCIFVHCQKMQGEGHGCVMNCKRLWYPFFRQVFLHLTITHAYNWFSKVFQSRYGGQRGCVNALPPLSNTCTSQCRDQAFLQR